MGNRRRNELSELVVHAGAGFVAKDRPYVRAALAPLRPYLGRRDVDDVSVEASLQDRGRRGAARDLAHHRAGYYDAARHGGRQPGLEARARRGEARRDPAARATSVCHVKASPDRAHRPIAGTYLP